MSRLRGTTALAGGCGAPRKVSSPPTRSAVAAARYSLYYVWVMVGQGREMIRNFDPQHACVQEGN